MAAGFAFPFLTKSQLHKCCGGTDNIKLPDAHPTRRTPACVRVISFFKLRDSFIRQITFASPPIALQLLYGYLMLPL